MRRIVFAGLLLAGIAPAIASSAPPAAVTAALADAARPSADRAADALRKPAETIAFAGVKLGMIVGEFYPAGGYFTRLLSVIVGPRGHVYGIENAGWKGAVKADDALLAGGKYANVSIETLPFGTVRFPKPIDLA